MRVSPAWKLRCARRWAGTWALALWGDVVRAQLADGGGPLPRIPAARVGVRLDTAWQGWEGQAEWVQVARQTRTAAYETRSSGSTSTSLMASRSALIPKYNIPQ